MTPPPQVELLKASGQTVIVKEFGFAGNASVDSETLRLAVASYLNRPLSLAELKNAAAEISLAYRRAGRVAAVSVPAQDASLGLVTLKIVESRFGGVMIDPASASGVRLSELAARIEAAQPVGTPTDLYRLDRGLLLANDLAGASVTGGLTAGDFKGETAFVLLAQTVPAWRTKISFDNSGALSTGAHRANAGLEYDNLQGLGDRVSVDAIFTEGSTYRRLGYALPLGAAGLQLNLSAGLLDYELVQGAFAASNVYGDSATLGAELTQAFVRARSFNLSGSLSFERRTFTNFASGSLSSDYATRRLELGVNANLYDGWAGGGVTSLSAGFCWGVLDLAGSPNQAAVAATTGAEGDFRKLRLTLARTQNLPGDCTLLLSLSAQEAFENLDSSEKLFAGGPGAVRAFPAGEGSGDAGVVGSAELRWQFRPQWQASMFVEAAQIRLNAQEDFPGAADDNKHGYQGGGVSLAWQGPAGSVWRAVWSRRLNDNPNPSPTGEDQDGSRHLNRWWLTAAINF